MSNLKEELTHMAADGANKARPLAIAEVVRRGNRRRARTIGQRSIGGLSVLGVSAAVIVAGAFHPLHGAAGHPASGKVVNSNTLTETTATSEGTLTVQIKYRYEPGAKIKLLSIVVKGKTTESIGNAFLGVSFGPLVHISYPAPGCGRVPAIVDSIFAIRLNENHRFAKSLPMRFNLGQGGTNVACFSEAMQVSVNKAERRRSLGLLLMGLVLGG